MTYLEFVWMGVPDSDTMLLGSLGDAGGWNERGSSKQLFSRRDKQEMATIERRITHLPVQLDSPVGESQKQQHIGRATQGKAYTLLGHLG